ncbi:MAG TPA: hypothetical protein PLE19_14485 [Planctomycetota bacterium]|nr:hypothetical protein [Planctomycetota bacterium]HRR82637.1 hypothetical protein [Planctomycetota bacterium]HRT96014.1 hypothetical protein [Planctomycetota bacterium]
MLGGLLGTLALFAVPIGYVFLLSYCFHRRYLRCAGLLLSAVGLFLLWLCDSKSKEGPYLAALGIALGLGGIHAYLTGMADDIVASVEDAQNDLNVRLIALETKLLERADDNQGGKEEP